MPVDFNTFLDGLGDPTYGMHDEFDFAQLKNRWLGLNDSSSSQGPARSSGRWTFRKSRCQCHVSSDFIPIQEQVPECRTSSLEK